MRANWCSPFYSYFAYHDGIRYKCRVDGSAFGEFRDKYSYEPI